MKESRQDPNAAEGRVSAGAAGHGHGLLHKACTTSTHRLLQHMGINSKQTATMN